MEGVEWGEWAGKWVRFVALVVGCGLGFVGGRSGEWVRFVIWLAGGGEGGGGDGGRVVRRWRTLFSPFLFGRCGSRDGAPLRYYYVVKIEMFAKNSGETGVEWCAEAQPMPLPGFGERLFVG